MISLTAALLVICIAHSALAQPAVRDSLRSAAGNGVNAAARAGSRIGDVQETSRVERRDYWLPAVEIVVFDAALNVFNRFALGDEYDSDLASIRRNLKRRWVVENDPYLINQFGHPYQGSMYHGFARSAGLGYWEALAYTFAGSAFWEIAGETTPPSWNDQLSTGIGGTFLGESLFRLASLVLERSDGSPDGGREFGAAALAPALGINRRVHGRRFDGVFDSREAAYYRRWQIGASRTTRSEPGASTLLRPNEAIIDVSLEYGLPGLPGYGYERPFDYFALQATGSSAAGFESLHSRGMLAGMRYGMSDSYRGIWGLYGIYDYISPVFFRVSSTALALGTTGQWWASDAIALQGSFLGGAGYAAVGTIRGTGESDYHYGIAPQALLATRLIFGDRASLDLTAREYYVSDVAPANTEGHDRIDRWEGSLTVRVHRQNAVAVRYLRSGRASYYPGTGDQRQSRATVALLFTFLGHDRFGAVQWPRSQPVRR